MTVKDELIKKTADLYKIPVDVVAAIVSHQFDSASAATALNNSIEISGFGKFVFNQKRALTQMEKYESQIKLFSGALENTELTDAERANLHMRIQTVLSNIKHLKPKINELKTDDRGMEK